MQSKTPAVRSGMYAKNAAPKPKRTYVRIDPKLIRVCVACKRKNARIQLVPMSRTQVGTVRLNRSSVTSGRPVTVCDRKTCITKALEQKKFDYWVKLPLGQDIKHSIVAG